MSARDQWLTERRSGVGGSDVAAILGLSEYKTRLQIYQEKCGEAGPQPDNESMLWGRALEPVIRQQYAERTGRTVRVPEQMIRHPQYGFMIANLDGFTEDERVFEAKTSRTAQGWGEPGSDEVPQAYLLQVQHYMTVTGFAVADVAVLIGGSDFRIYEVPADGELQQMLIDEEADFWACVQRGNPPDPVNCSDVYAKYGRAVRAGEVDAEPHVLAAIETLRAIREQYKALETSEETAKMIVMQALGEYDTLKHGSQTLATWKIPKPAQRFDGTAFKAVHADLYAQFLKAGEVSRRFLLK